MADGGGIEPVGRVKFEGHTSDGGNLSAAGLVGDLLLVAGDEDDRIQVLRRRGDHYELLPGREVVLNDSRHEADVEGIAVEGDTVYVVGSHSRKRPKPKPSASRDVNRERIETIEPASPFRDILARFRLAADGSHSDLEITSLRDAIERDAILGRFAPIPCKENGVDIEGLAVRDGLLLVGFRGPVLQRGFVPILTCGFARPISVAGRLHVELGGRGVRDLERVEGGYLVLSGPVSDISASFQLHFWDGRDGLPGADAPAGEGGPIFLGEVPTPPGAKAEGLAVEEESAGHYTAILLFDGPDEGGARRMRIRKPTSSP